MSQQNDNNGFLYFMVGVLLVAVIGIGYIFMGGNAQDNTTDLAIIETSAGEESSTQETFSFEMDDNGFEASQTEETSN